MACSSNRRVPGAALLAVLSLGMPYATHAAAPVLTTLYSFTGVQGDGRYPYAGVTLGSGGVLFGTTLLGTAYGSGTVFELTPPATTGGAWTETVLYAFSGGDGANPYATPTVGKRGELFGTTDVGGAFNAGTVFELTPPSAGGTWTEAILHNFINSSGDGIGPYAGLISHGGIFYGTTSGGGASHGGTVFQLTPSTSGGAWTETVLYSFTGANGDGQYPNANVTAGANGVLYGTTQSGGASDRGTVFQLTPPSAPGGAWTETVLYSFTGASDGGNPLCSMTLGSGGVLYGTASSGGTMGNGAVFELTPPTSGGAWTETVLYSFTGQKGDGALPYAGVVLGNNGGLFGTTFSGGTVGQGTVFELKPPATPGGAWTEMVLHHFTGGDDGANPYAGLILSKGMFYGTTTVGGASGYGAVFQLQP